MSAPQTNLEKQKRWHRGPLVGMAAGIIFVGVMFLWLTGAFSPVPDETPIPVDGVTAPLAEGATAPAEAVPNEAAPTSTQPTQGESTPSKTMPAQPAPVEN